MGRVGDDEEPLPVKVAPVRDFVVRIKCRLTGQVWEFTRKEQEL